MSEAGRSKADSQAETRASAELPDYLLAKLRVSIPGYELVDKIASGGQATVYRARELTSGLTVAIKVLHGGPYASADARTRFLREATALKKLNHPNIVCVIDFGRTPIGLDYLVMNYVSGRPLDAIWKDPAFSAAIAPEPPARLRLFKRICDIVHAAHLKGITHRDLSPSNILIDAEGEPHILDFGLVSTAFNELLNPAGGPVSITGQFLGKVHYAAPEQVRAKHDTVDPRTDVYALGVILYQLLTNGVFPYDVVSNFAEALHNIVHTKPQRPSAVLARRQEAKAGRLKLRTGPPLVNPIIEAVVLRALEKDPAHRYQSAAEVAADIDQYLAGRNTSVSESAIEQPPVASAGSKGRHRLFATLGVISIVALVAGLWGSFHPQSGRHAQSAVPAGRIRPIDPPSAPLSVQPPVPQTELPLATAAPQQRAPAPTGGDGQHESSQAAPRQQTIAVSTPPPPVSMVRFKPPARSPPLKREAPTLLSHEDASAIATQIESMYLRRSSGGWAGFLVGGDRGAPGHPDSKAALDDLLALARAAADKAAPVTSGEIAALRQAVARTREQVESDRLTLEHPTGTGNEAALNIERILDEMTTRLRTANK
jgi:serine/threonine protein kinase